MTCNNLSIALRRMRLKSKAASLMAFLTILAAILAGCGTNPQNEGLPSLLDQAHERVCAYPVRMSLLADATLSGIDGGIKLPDRADLERAAHIIEQCSGELAFTIVADDASRHLLRYRVERSPNNLKEPARDDYPDAFSYSTALTNFRREAEKALVHEAERLEEIARRKLYFLDEVERVLSEGATYTSTDLNAIIRRSKIYHEESTVSWGGEVAEYAVYITDGKHNADQSRVEDLPEDVDVLVVYGSTDLGIFNALTPKPMRFESVEAAITHVDATEVKR